MTYRDITFCLRSQESYCKESGCNVCVNTDCFRHSSTIPYDKLPSYMLFSFSDFGDRCNKLKENKND